MSTSRFLDPALLAAVDDLPLMARAVVDGFLLGQHHSRRTGTGLEFNQYRGYEPGDDPRLLDWKMFARSDRYFVREAEEETAIGVWLLLDTSASMAHRDTGGLTKLASARVLAAVLAQLAHRQGDGVGLVTAGGDEGDLFLPARSGRRHLYRIFANLDALSAAGRWPAWETVEATLTRDRRRGLYVVISDLYDHQSHLAACLNRLRAMGHELIVCQLMAKNEWQFDAKGPVQLRDLETGDIIDVDGRQAAQQARRRLQAHQQFWQDRLGQLAADYVRINLGEPLDQTLRTFLSTRTRLV